MAGRGPAYCCCFCCGWVQEMNAGVVESCGKNCLFGILNSFNLTFCSIGKFSKVLPAGCYFVFWPVTNLVHTVSLQVQYMEMACDTKTKDNVFVKVVVAVQYRVMVDKVPSAYYKLTDARQQIRSYVFDVVRGSVPRMELDEAFASKDDIANSVKTQLETLMAEYGYEIVAALVIDLDPNEHVKGAMNDIMGE
jgi:regulator of protease activity HflC (stomatin/prohibitin superfamily)